MFWWERKKSKKTQVKLGVSELLALRDSIVKELVVYMDSRCRVENAEERNRGFRSCIFNNKVYGWKNPVNSDVFVYRDKSMVVAGSKTNYLATNCLGPFTVYGNTVYGEGEGPSGYFLVGRGKKLENVTRETWCYSIRHLMHNPMLTLERVLAADRLRWKLQHPFEFKEEADLQTYLDDLKKLVSNAGLENRTLSAKHNKRHSSYSQFIKDMRVWIGKEPGFGDKCCAFFGARSPFNSALDKTLAKALKLLNATQKTLLKQSVTSQFKLK